LGVGEIVLGGVLALILIRRIRKDDSFPEGEKAPPTRRVENREPANRV
jgi:hypothetical protein